MKNNEQEGELAQLGERLLCTQEVSGSIPLFSTIIVCEVIFSLNDEKRPSDKERRYAT